MFPRKTSRKTRTKRCFLSWFVQKIDLFPNHFTKHNNKKSVTILESCPCSKLQPQRLGDLSVLLFFYVTLHLHKIFLNFSTPQSTYINIYNFIWNIHFFLPPKFPQGLAQFCVVQVWILIRELSAGRLRPDHERIHGSLDVRFTLQGSVPSHGHWYQGPVVPL